MLFAQEDEFFSFFYIAEEKICLTDAMQRFYGKLQWRRAGFFQILKNILLQIRAIVYE